MQYTTSHPAACYSTTGTADPRVMLDAAILLHTMELVTDGELRKIKARLEKASAQGR